MRTRPTLPIILALVVAVALACAPTTQSQDTLKQAIDSSYADWTSIRLGSPRDLTINAESDLPLAYAVLDSGWDDTTAIIPTDRCNNECLKRVENFLLEQKPESINILVTEECWPCADSRLVMIDQKSERMAFLSQEEVIGRIAPIDTYYEAMLASGKPGKIRTSDNGFDVISDTTLSDCDPVVTRKSLFSVSVDGSKKLMDEIDVTIRGCM